MEKMWSGRFTASASSLLDDFNASIMFDRKLYLEDKNVNLDELSVLIKDMHPDVRYILLKTDKDATMEMSVKVMDALRLGGAKRFVIATIPKG